MTALLRVLAGETLPHPPVWFMRQAGRHLPEYRALRATTPDFVSFCLDPEKAAEATLQPMRRYPMDAAIVFADILLIPRALGQAVWFETGEGPRLGALPGLEAMRDLAPAAGAALAEVGQTLTLVRAALEPERTLIGFAGGPWTVLTYMLAGRGGQRDVALAAAYANLAHVEALLAVIVQATVDYLAMQANSGAQVVKIFESWAEGLPDDLFGPLVIDPHKAIIEGLRARDVSIPVIGFPRGCGGHYARYKALVPVDGLALDTSVPLEEGQALRASEGHAPAIQGALDPILLRTGGAMLDRRVDALLEAWGGGPYIFNLGHGVIPDTPIAHVEQVLRRVQG